MLPTVTHPVDKTARIQIVTEQSNPFFYNILKKYKELTGIGCLVNTSFNVHNEPIVNKPEEAFMHLKNGIIDFLVTPYGIYSKLQENNDLKKCYIMLMKEDIMSK